MPEFVNEELGCRFTIPDRPTLRQQLRYAASIGTTKQERFIGAWEGAKSLIQDWQCEKLPDPTKIDMDDEVDLKTANLIIWAGQQVMGHIASLEDIPKNS